MFVFTPDSRSCDRVAEIAQRNYQQHAPASSRSRSCSCPCDARRLPPRRRAATSPASRHSTSTASRPPWRTASSVVLVSSEFYHQPHTLLFLSPAASSLSSTLPRVASSLPAAACCPPPTAPCVSTSTRPFCGPFPAHCTLLHAPPDTRPHQSRALDGSSARWLLSLSSHMWKEPSPDPTPPARSRPPPHAADGAAAPLCCPHSRQPQMPVPRGCLTAAALACSCVHSWVSADTGGGNADGRLSGGSISGVRRRVTRLARWTDPHRVGCSPLAATWWGEI